MVQIFFTLCIFLIIVIPIGHYLYKISDNKKTFGESVFNRIEETIFKICKVNKENMNLKQYIMAIILTNGLMIFIGYLILRIQNVLILNPNGIKAMDGNLSLNTVVSFMTNTNLQHYAGETALSYLSQMVVITFMMFTASATGYSVCMAFIRGVVGKKSMGNFYVDLVKIIVRVLLPFSIIVSILLVWQGVPQTFLKDITVHTIEGKYQDIAMGPMASLEAIKHLGTNGGGFLAANSATPLENPTIISNLIELFSMMVLPGACVFAFGLMIYNRKKEEGLINKTKNKKVILGGDGRAIFTAMFSIFIIGVIICFLAEKAGNPALAKIGLSNGMGNMEGKELRFGVAQSSLFTTTTTAFTTGSVNNMHDSLTPIGGMVALLNMMLNVVFGGKGVGLMNMIIYAILTVFICELMIGRTPEYLGKKIEGKEMKLTALCIILHPLLILTFTTIALMVPAGLNSITNPGFHGLSQVLYEFTSAASNNGSGFEGLLDNTVFWNTTTAIVMFLGRYVMMVLQLAIAYSLMTKPRINESVGTLKTNNLTFTIALIIIVLIFAALTFLPVLALGPVAEQLTLWH